ncbi:hypothetical protein E8E14_001142 [Neopestalotiopsis sp. 37M]|nr:hypothetical protein E8E14_001142 [Neopestalotiopsis sp. 37M]
MLSTTRSGTSVVTGDVSDTLSELPDVQSHEVQAEEKNGVEGDPGDLARASSPKPSKKRKQRTQRACESCREKKVWCGGGLPACGKCVVANRTCRYSPYRHHFDQKRSRTHCGQSSTGESTKLREDVVMPVDLTQSSENSANNVPIPETQAVSQPQEIQEHNLWKGNLATPLRDNKQQHWQQVTNQPATSSQNEKTFQKQPHQSQIMPNTHYPSPDSFFDLNYTMSPNVAPCPSPVIEHESASLPDNAVGLLDIYFAYTDSWLPIVNKIAILQEPALGDKWRRVVWACFILDTLLAAAWGFRPHLRSADLGKIGNVAESDTDGVAVWDLSSTPGSHRHSAICQATSQSSRAFNRTKDLVMILNDLICINGHDIDSMAQRGRLLHVYFRWHQDIVGKNNVLNLDVLKHPHVHLFKKLFEITMSLMKLKFDRGPNDMLDILIQTMGAHAVGLLSNVYTGLSEMRKALGVSHMPAAVGFVELIAARFKFQDNAHDVKSQPTSNGDSIGTEVVLADASLNPVATDGRTVNMIGEFEPDSRMTFAMSDSSIDQSVDRCAQAGSDLFTPQQVWSAPAWADSYNGANQAGGFRMANDLEVKAPEPLRDEQSSKPLGYISPPFGEMDDMLYNMLDSSD